MGLAFPMESGAQEAVTQIAVRITAVKESDWQREQAKPEPAAGLRERLNARTLVELSGAVNEDKPTILRSGQERDIVTEWGFDQAKDEAIATKTVQELIGTEVRLLQEPPKNHAGATRISLTLTHDLSPPLLQSLTYATAAVGAERDKRSVTAPRYERLRWQGEVLVGVGERIIASFRPANDTGTRIVVFFKGSGGSTVAPSLAVRQTIYRVPEMAMIEWLLQGAPDDVALADHLQTAVAAGQASIVSSTALTLAPHASTKMQVGTEWWLPTESDQIFDRLYLPPTAFMPALEGTRLTVDAIGGFQSFYGPHAPLAVQWPTSWLRVYDRKSQRPTGKAIHGRMDWYDRFEQEIVGASLSDSASPQLVAMMPPADQVWGTDRQGRWLDVTVAQLSGDIPKPAAQPATPEPADPFAPPANPFATGWAAQPPKMRSLILGFALDSNIAHALLETRQPEQDEALLRDLLARVKRGEARVMTCAFSAHNSNRFRQSSARIHAYPTEMPSIPSAWADRQVGTSLEQDTQTLAIDQDLAPPARSEWKLARNVPEAIMWEPRFRRFSSMSDTVALTTPGTHLLAAVDVPAVMTSADLPAHETILLFSHLDTSADAPAVTQHDVEIETLIFEIPAQDAAAWQTVQNADFATFTQQRLKNGQTKLQSHTMLCMKSGSRGVLSVVEEYMTATEFDPPDAAAPFRIRPTALKTLPVGLQFEADGAVEESGGMVNLNVKLRLSTAKPVEPGLKETLKISASGHEKYPGAKHEFDEWTKAVRTPLGAIHCFGLSQPLGSGVTSTRIAFLRVRPAR